MKSIKTLLMVETNDLMQIKFIDTFSMYQHPQDSYILVHKHVDDKKLWTLEFIIIYIKFSMIIATQSIIFISK
jgi:hypothetical protein